MKIDVRFRGLDASGALEQFTVRRVQARFARFGREVRGVVVRISDVNGPRGGIDKRCQVEIRGPRFGAAAVQVMAEDPYAAVGQALERASRQVGRKLERQRRLRRPLKLQPTG